MYCKDKGVRKRRRNDVGSYIGWANAKIEELLNTHPNDAKYEELLMAVARKFPNESRHETALRYITEAESKDYGTASEGCKQSSEGK